MRRRRIIAFHPDVERFEVKRLLSAGASSTHVAHLGREPGGHPLAAARGDAATGPGTPAPLPKHFLAYRITNPTYRIVHLVPPFQHVLVQRIQPVPGRVYNLLYVVVMNGTGQTFTAADH